MYPLPPGRASAATRAVLNAAIEEIPDVELDTDYQHLAGALTEGYRSIVAVPMLMNARTVGAIAVSRSHVGPFPPRQIELLQTFAGQGVIAIENARLFEEVQSRTAELTASLEQQTASSGVLQLISSSPGELQPVFDAMLENATRICEANFGVLTRLHCDVVEVVATLGLPPELSALWQGGPARVDRHTGLGRVIETKQTVHIIDVTTDQATPSTIRCVLLP